MPPLTDLEETEKNQILGEAYALRALHLHNLTKFWGDVPMPLVSPTSVEEASQITRTPAAEVYAQIRADLAQAETLVTETGDATRVTAGFVDALQARVALYEADYATAAAEADEVLAQGYELAEDFTTLFDAEGTDTPEDILKVIFTAEQFTWHGFYYTSADLGGEGSVGPSQKLIDLFDPADVRGTWSIFGDTEGEASGLKFPTTIGAEDFHVIRLAEVLLIKAEALARQNDLVGAVDAYNPIRVRAGLSPHTLGDEVTHPGGRAGGDRPTSASSSSRSRVTAGPTWFGTGWRTMSWGSRSSRRCTRSRRRRSTSRLGSPRIRGIRLMAAAGSRPPVELSRRHRNLPRGMVGGGSGGSSRGSMTEFLVELIAWTGAAVPIVPVFPAGHPQLGDSARSAHLPPGQANLAPHHRSSGIPADPVRAVGPPLAAAGIRGRLGRKSVAAPPGEQPSLKRRVASGWTFLKAIARKQRTTHHSGPEGAAEAADHPGPEPKQAGPAETPRSEPATTVTSEPSAAQRRQWTFYS